MCFQDLSLEDQRLLQTDLGEFDKVASEQVALIDEMYSTGFNKLAAETADWLDKLAEEEEEEDEDEMDHDGEKTASVFGAWTERGFFDGLRKLGSDRHGDELHYLYPFIEEKLAAKASKGMLDSAKKSLNKLKAKVSGGYQSAKKSVNKYNAKMVADAKAGWSGRAAGKKGKKGKKLTTSERAKALGMAGLRATPYGVAAGGMGYGGYRALNNDEE